MVTAAILASFLVPEVSLLTVRPLLFFAEHLLLSFLACWEFGREWMTVLVKRLFYTRSDEHLFFKDSLM